MLVCIHGAGRCCVGGGRGCICGAFLLPVAEAYRDKETATGSERMRSATHEVTQGDQQRVRPPMLYAQQYLYRSADCSLVGLQAAA
jgi:hypothetical protein